MRVRPEKAYRITSSQSITSRVNGSLFRHASAGGERSDTLSGTKLALSFACGIGRRRPHIAPNVSFKIHPAAAEKKIRGFCVPVQAGNIGASR